MNPGKDEDDKINRQEQESPKILKGCCIKAKFDNSCMVGGTFYCQECDKIKNANPHGSNSNYQNGSGNAECSRTLNFL